MKITDIKTMRLLGPIPHAMGGDLGTFTKYIIRVAGEGGLFGLGEAEYMPGVDQAINYIRSVIMGRDVLDLRPIVSQMLYGSIPPHDPHLRPHYDKKRFPDTSPAMPVALCCPTSTTTGPFLWGISGVDMALTDLAGKLLKTPAYNVLGGKFRDRVHIYLDRSTPGADADKPETWAKMAREAVEAGFPHMKFDAEYVCQELTREYWNRSLTGAQINLIVRKLTAVREAVGFDAEICLDGHTQYNVPSSIRLAQELAPLKLAWFEDPCPNLNPDAAREVRTKSSIPICLGEMFNAEQFRLFIDHEAIDILHPDILFCGGMHEMVRIAEYADLHYLPMAMHGNGGALSAIAASHVAASVRNFLGLEYHFIEADWVARYVRREGVELFEDGHIRLTDAPGLGVTLDEAICRQHLAPGEKYIG